MELSKGPKEKQKVGRNHPNRYENNRSNRRNRSSETKEMRNNRRRPMKPFIGNPGGNRRQVRTVQAGTRRETGLSGDKRKRWVRFRRRLAAGVILGRPTCQVANSSAANQ